MWYFSRQNTNNNTPFAGHNKREKKEEQEESVSVKVILNKEYQKTFERAFIPNS